MEPRIIGRTMHPPLAPMMDETWEQVHRPFRVAGGTPYLLVEDTDGEVYQHTPDGRLWRLQRVTTPPDDAIMGSHIGGANDH